MACKQTRASNVRKCSNSSRYKTFHNVHEFLCKNVHHSEESNAHILLEVFVLGDTPLPGDGRSLWTNVSNSMPASFNSSWLGSKVYRMRKKENRELM